MMGSVVPTQPFENRDHRLGNARWHPNNCGLVHGGIRTRRRKLMDGSTGGEAQPCAAREPHKLEAWPLTEYRDFYPSARESNPFNQHSPGA